MHFLLLSVDFDHGFLHGTNAALCSPAGGAAGGVLDQWLFLHALLHDSCAAGEDGPSNNNNDNSMHDGCPLASAASRGLPNVL